jgi:hypothetical protein
MFTALYYAVQRATYSSRLSFQNWPSIIKCMEQESLIDRNICPCFMKTLRFINIFTPQESNQIQTNRNYTSILHILFLFYRLCFNINAQSNPFFPIVFSFQVFRLRKTDGQSITNTFLENIFNCPKCATCFGFFIKPLSWTGISI